MMKKFFNKHLMFFLLLHPGNVSGLLLPSNVLTIPLNGASVLNILCANASTDNLLIDLTASKEAV